MIETVIVVGLESESRRRGLLREAALAVAYTN
jgi:hypothetical protein